MDGSWAKSGADKATTFAEHVAELFTTIPNTNPSDNEIESFLIAPCQMSLPIKYLFH